MVQRQSIFYDFSGAYSDASDRLTYKVCSCERKTAEKNYTVTTSLTVIKILKIPVIYLQTSLCPTLALFEAINTDIMLCHRDGAHVVSCIIEHLSKICSVYSSTYFFFPSRSTSSGLQLPSKRT